MSFSPLANSWIWKREKDNKNKGIPRKKIGITVPKDFHFCFSYNLYLDI